MVSFNSIDILTSNSNFLRRQGAIGNYCAKNARSSINSHRRILPDFTVKIPSIVEIHILLITIHEELCLKTATHKYEKEK